MLVQFEPGANATVELLAGLTSYQNETDGFNNVVVPALDGERIMTVDVDVASGAVVVRAADIDGDGALDVVSAAAEDDTVAVYRASKWFSKRLAASDAVGVTDVVVLDVDGGHGVRQYADAATDPMRRGD